MLYGFGAGVSAEEPEDAESQAYVLREVDEDLEDLDEEIPEDVPPEPSWLEKLKDGFKLDGYELFVLFLWPLMLELVVLDYMVGHFASGPILVFTLPISLPLSLVIGILSLPIMLILRPAGLFGYR